MFRLGLQEVPPPVAVAHIEGKSKWIRGQATDCALEDLNVILRSTEINLKGENKNCKGLLPRLRIQRERSSPFCNPMHLGENKDAGN